MVRLLLVRLLKALALDELGLAVVVVPEPAELKLGVLPEREATCMLDSLSV